MKKRINLSEQKEVHISNVKKTDIIEVIEKSNREGVIVFNRESEKWNCISFTGYCGMKDTLYEAIEWFEECEDLEFYVL